MDVPAGTSSAGIPGEQVPPAASESLLARIGRMIAFVVSRKLYKPQYLLMALRFLRLKVVHPHVRTEGFVFLGKNVQIYAPRGYARLTLGRWCTIGPGTSICCHEGNLRIGSKVIFGRQNTVSSYLDVEIGDDCIFADWIYVCDFDHRYGDLNKTIKKQGIVKAPVRIGSDCWIGEKATILRGVTIGDGCVVASHSLVNRDVPPRSVAGGVPARVLKSRAEGSQRP